jgi:hypothetical protein
MLATPAALGQLWISELAWAKKRAIWHLEHIKPALVAYNYKFAGEALALP